jgi:hypothetical protein
MLGEWGAPPPPKKKEKLQANKPEKIPNNIWSRIWSPMTICNIYKKQGKMDDLSLTKSSNQLIMVSDPVFIAV